MAPTGAGFLQKFGPVFAWGLTYWFAVGLIIWRFGWLIGVPAAGAIVVVGALVFAVLVRLGDYFANKTLDNQHH